MVKLDGKSPEEFGLLFLKGHYHPATPEMRNRTMTIPGMPGEWDFGSEWGSRTFSLPFAVIEYNKYELQRKLRAFVAFLVDAYGKAREIKLSFDYEPDKYYLVKLNGRVEVERAAQTGQLDLPLIAHKPMARFIVPTDEITMDSDVWVLSDITVGAQYVYSITGNQTITVINDGNTAISPTMEISGSASTLSLSTGGKTFTLSNLSGTYSVDGESYTVKKDGVSTLTIMTGNFLTLLPGENQITVSGTGMNINIEFKFQHQYI